MVVAVVALALAPGAAAQAAPGTRAGVPEKDKEYLRAAHQTHLTVIEAGELAEHKQVSVRIRDFAIRLVTEHREMDRTVSKTASKLRVSLPDEPNETQRATLEHLRAADGTEFAAQFVLSQQEEHLRARQSAEMEATNRGSDSRAKRVARESLPRLQAHEEELRALAKDLGMSVPSSPPAPPPPDPTEVPPPPPPRRGGR